MSKKLRKKLVKLGKLQAIYKKATAKAEKGGADLRKLEDKHWRERFPAYFKQFKKAPKSHKGVWGDWFPDGLRDTELHLMDSAGQCLDFRVGPVFGKGGIYKQPGIWVGVQRVHLGSARDIELLISPEMWRKLNKEMELRFKEFNPRGYRTPPHKVITAKRP